MKKTCGNCWWALWQRNPRDKILRNYPGQCLWVPNKYPMAMAGSYYGGVVGYTMKADRCPVWRAKE
jgi:hypothetical protein